MTSQEETFAKKLEALVAAFVTDEPPDETESDLANAFLEFALNYERLRHQIIAGSKEELAVDAQTIAKMQSWDSNDPAMSTLEKVLRRLAEGRGEYGIQLLKDSIKVAAQETSKKQAEVAKHPRKSRQQPMSGLVESIVRQEPNISQHHLSKALKRKLATMVDPPYSHSDNLFKSKDNRFSNIEYAALGQYMYRAKKKLSL